MTKAEKERHEAEQLTRLATLQDIKNEQQHRQRNTWIGAAAILVTAIFSLASCAAARDEIQTMEMIAAQDRARERDQLRLRCAEQMSEAAAPLLLLGLAISAVEFSADAAGSSLDPALMVGPLDEYGKAGAICSAAGQTEGVAEQRFSDALSGMFLASNRSFDEQNAAAKEMIDASDAYIVIPMTGVGKVFETDTGRNDGVD